MNTKIKEGLDKNITLRSSKENKLGDLDKFIFPNGTDIEKYAKQRYFIKSLYRTVLRAGKEIQIVEEEIERLKNRRVQLKQDLEAHFSEQFEKLIGRPTKIRT